MYSMNASDSPGGGTPGVQSLSAGATAVETTAVTPLVGIETTDAVTPLVAVAKASLAWRPGNGQLLSPPRTRRARPFPARRLLASGRRRDHPWLGSDESSVGVHKRKREGVFPRQLKAIGRSRRRAFWMSPGL